jgi:hypothetical protein
MCPPVSDRNLCTVTEYSDWDFHGFLQSFETSAGVVLLFHISPNRSFIFILNLYSKYSVVIDRRKSKTAESYSVGHKFPAFMGPEMSLP